MTEEPSIPSGAGRRPLKQEQQPASSEITEVGPGVLRLQIPIFFTGLGHVNCYALLDGKGATVVDAGMPGRATWRALTGRLHDAGLRVRDVHTVIVTHSHPDHFGCAGTLARESGAELVTERRFHTWLEPKCSAAVPARAATRRDTAAPPTPARRSPTRGRMARGTSRVTTPATSRAR
ncbi:MAG TPA: MBL fold metallo-hydrolase, partial [Acidimicrobiales bacterium]|nr:MBL fold metallo-hydrolase [Acidimicrobiales bacterium]